MKKLITTSILLLSFSTMADIDLKEVIVGALLTSGEEVCKDVESAFEKIKSISHGKLNAEVTSCSQISDKIQDRNKININIKENTLPCEDNSYKLISIPKPIAKYVHSYAILNTFLNNYGIRRVRLMNDYVYTDSTTMSTKPKNKSEAYLVPACLLL